MVDFPVQDYGNVVAALLDPDRLCELGPGCPVPEMRSRLQQLTTRGLLGDRPVANYEMAACCLAGLWLWNDYLDESHSISQGISSNSGSYWHGIMHRREPDYPNSKYWFRRVGDHPIFPRLLDATAELVSATAPNCGADDLASQAEWDPFQFVDLCQHASGTTTALEELCRRIARIEWYLLFDFCWQHAVGGVDRG